jgi:hypothetical protein
MSGVADGLRTLTRRDVAAYLLDRADQFDTESSVWQGLADAAENVMLGEVEVAILDRQLDEEIYARVDGFLRNRGKPIPVDPKMGCDE